MTTKAALHKTFKGILQKEKEGRYNHEILEKDKLILEELVEQMKFKKESSIVNSVNQKNSHMNKGERKEHRVFKTI
jgi:hypothetical protein